jgi:hypothetical protein
MADRTYRRLTRYAVFSVLQLVVFLAVLLLGVEQGLAGLAFVAVTLPLLWAWGHFLADIELNPFLDDATRQRWRLAVYLVPGALAIYWHRYVRAQRTLV